MFRRQVDRLALSVMLNRVKQLKNWDHPSVMLNRVKHLNTSTVR